jgi:hypothetical protein
VAGAVAAAAGLAVMGMVAGAGLVVLLLKELFALIFIDFLWF